MNRGVRRRTSLVLVVVAALVAACGVEAVERSGVVGTSERDAQGSDVTPTTEIPFEAPPRPPDVEITGDDGSEINDVAASAIADLDAWWATEYPAVYGEEYEPVSGGFFAVDSSTDPATLPCAVPDIELVLYNAYYCPPDDAIAWDQEGLMPDLADQFGSFTVAVVMAHEWGHAIQARAGVREPTVVTELQADCFAGAWARHVRDDDASGFTVSIEELDRAFAGILALKDAPGSLATDPNAHGSGFDRVGAFQDGFEGSNEVCATYTASNVDPYQFPFNDEEERVAEGDLPLEDINTLAFESLELYWEDVFPTLDGAGSWEALEDPVSFSRDDPPVCNGREETRFSLFLCVPDRFVAYDGAETIPQVYELGDFAVGVLYGTQYGLAVQDQLGGIPDDEVTATLRGDCYAGAWAGGLMPEEGQTSFPYRLRLSPGDLDEAVAVLLTSRSDVDRERQGPGFGRVRAFRIGVVEGPDACEGLQSAG